MTEAPSTQHPAMQQSEASSPWASAIILGSLVFVAALLGIWTRPIGFLSAVWPANALLLGALLHKPRWLSPAAALAVACGYISADLLTGSRIDVAVLLCLANMAGVAAAWSLMHKQTSMILLMQRQSSALLLFMGCGLGAVISAAIGGPVLTTVFHTPPWQAFSMWLSGEWLSYMLLLPIVLAFPAHKQKNLAADKRHPVLHALPLLSVIALELASYWLGGPGALVFSLPALLWCALSYRIFTLTLITAALCLSKMIAVSVGSFVFTPDHFLESVSFRIGLCMLVLGPLAVAGSHLARNELMRKLSHAVNHDFLTDVLARGAFLQQGQRLLERCLHDKQPFAVFMLDLDHFKQVNDNFGHAGGDQLLQAFSTAMTQVLRPQDIVGRLGGEEFAVVLPSIHINATQEVAQRILQATRELSLPSGEHVITATVSIGLIHISSLHKHQNLDLWLQHADQALYNAKAAGRDRVMARLL